MCSRPSLDAADSQQESQLPQAAAAGRAHARSRTHRIQTRERAPRSWCSRAQAWRSRNRTQQSAVRGPRLGRHRPGNTDTALRPRHRAQLE
eukprot:1247011-Pyramimonas_sp.AAC.1